MNLLGDSYAQGSAWADRAEFLSIVNPFAGCSPGHKNSVFSMRKAISVCSTSTAREFPKMRAKAFAPFQDGAEKGNAFMYVFLRDVLRRGVGVEKDRKAARTWYVARRSGRQSHGHRMVQKTIFRWQVNPKPLITIHLSFVTMNIHEYQARELSVSLRSPLSLEASHPRPRRRNESHQAWARASWW